MIVPDANLLLYAYDASSPFQARAARWWEDRLSGTEAVGLCVVVLLAFIRIGTSRRAFTAPLAVTEATGHIRSWLGRSVTEVLTADASDLERAMTLLEEAGAAGNLTTDALVASIAKRHRATVHTADTDFARFKGVRALNPLT